MEEAARRFARRVLLIHLAVLLGVVAVVFFASREVYDETRRQASKQAQSRQLLLASQTARGIESYYRSIIDDLDLWDLSEHDPQDEPARATTPSPVKRKVNLRQLLGKPPEAGAGSGATRPAGGPVGAVVLREFFSTVLWTQLEGRSSLLFSLDRTTLGKPAKDRGPLGFERDRNAIEFMGGAPPHPAPRDIVLKPRNTDWLKGIEKPQISGMQQYQVGTQSVELNLVATPLGDKKSPRLLVAAVPIKAARSRFIDRISAENSGSLVLLLDHDGSVMTGTDPTLVGQQFERLVAAPDHSSSQPTAEECIRNVTVIDHPHTLGERKIGPSLMALASIHNGGKSWTLVVITPMSDVDNVVNQVFKKALFWAVFVVFSMTAILVSTSIQLIRSRIRHEKMRNQILTRELNQAREIQLAWLPREALAVPSIDLAAVNHPASHISGDFYNWFQLPDGRTVVTIGDVTGHGMAAAFLMATSQLLVHSTMLRLGDPGQTLAEVNRQLCMQIFNGQFVTMLIVVLDQQRGTIDVATAGHYPPLLGSGGEFKPLPMESQLVLGVENDGVYPTERFELPPSASLILYTDGVVDVRDEQGKRFEMSRLIKCLNGKTESAQELIDSIVARINQFRGPRDLPDDLTLVCIQAQLELVQRQAAPQAIET